MDLETFIGYHDDDMGAMLSNIYRDDPDFVLDRYGFDIDKGMAFICKYNYSKSFEYYINNYDIDVKSITYKGKTLLEYACEWHRQKNYNDYIRNIICEFTKKHGIDVYKIKSQSPLAVALRDIDEEYGSLYKPRQLKIIQYLVNAGVDVKWVNKDDKTPLMILCSNTMVNYSHCMDVQLRIIKVLVEAGVDVSYISKYENSALLEACWGCDVNIIQYLIENGAHTSEKALTNAATANTLNVVQYLYNIKVPIPNDILLHTTFIGKWHDAKYKRNKINISKYLIKCGANVNVHCSAADYNKTPLMYSVLSNCLTLVRCLDQNGADINARDKNGDTALDHAYNTDANLSIITYLLGHGAKEGKGSD